MTDEVTNEPKTFTAEEVEAMLEEKTASLKAKNNELLDELKPVKQKAKELEEERERIERESLEKNQEFQTLYEREQKRAAEAASALTELQETVKQKEIRSTAEVIAAKLTDDVGQARMLTKELASIARLTDNGVVFERGGVAIDNDAVLQYAKEEYPFLCKGSGSAGGGAAGNFSGGAAAAKGDMGGNREERAAAIAQKFKLPK